MSEALIAMGLNFQKERKRRGYSQHELAVLLKRSQSTIVTIEKGQLSKEAMENHFLDLIALPPKPVEPKIKYHPEYINGLKDARRALINQSNHLTRMIRHADAGKSITKFLEEPNNQQ